METILYKLPVFEGPLDTLLYLVQKNKLNIYDIPIAELLEQYLDTIRQMKEADLDIATEFLDMAARLVQIKSAMLLPKYEEDPEQMKRELTGELIEYHLCKQAAQRLAGVFIGFDVFVREPEEVEPDYTYRRQHPPEVLFDAYLAAAGRGRRKLPPSKQVFAPLVEREIVPVSTQITFVLGRLYRRRKVAFGTLFESAHSRSEMVATFLALLELIKAKRIHVEGEGSKQEVRMLDETEQTERTEETDGIDETASGS